MQSNPSRVPVHTVNEIISYNSRQNMFERKHEKTKCINPINNSKHYEFLWVLQQQTNCSFNENEWEPDILSPSLEDALCICSQKIRYKYKIKHTPTGQSFLVGSECIKKISKNLYNSVIKPKCIICGNPILNRRTRLGKKNICSVECNSMVMPFGKYKNQNITTVPLSYLEWIYKQDWVNVKLKNMITYHVFENQQNLKNISK